MKRALTWNDIVFNSSDEEFDDFRRFAIARIGLPAWDAFVKGDTPHLSEVVHAWNQQR